MPHARQRCTWNTRQVMGGGNTTSSELLPPLGAEPLGVETLPRAEQDAVPAGSVAWLESGLWCPAAHQRGSQVFPAPQEESSGVLGQRKCLQNTLHFLMLCNFPIIIFVTPPCFPPWNRNKSLNTKS